MMPNFQIMGILRENSWLTCREIVHIETDYNNTIYIYIYIYLYICVCVFVCVCVCVCMCVRIRYVLIGKVNGKNYLCIKENRYSISYE